MKLDQFGDPNRLFSVVLFLQPADVEPNREEIENVGKQRNVQLVVQPCAFEGIEFLYRVADDLIGHSVSMDKDIFWQAIELKKGTSPDIFKKISQNHHEYLCAILEQDVSRVRKARKALESLATHFA
ncbi:MAG TPA: hypothetical protein VI895_11905 [Bdellovibrionota bacterium]|nr:hypothetical protein [Bdellovibrionota bacterium]